MLQRMEATAMSVTGKWIDLIHRVATGNARYRILFAPLVGLLYAAFIGFFILISIQFDSLLKLPAFGEWPYTIYISTPIIIIGFALMVYSVIHFLKVRGTPVPLSPPPVLVTSGPYRYARNPMLTGIFIQLFGAALLLRSLSLLCLFTPLFIAINVWELKMVEEPELEKRLGRVYVDYKKRVPMFFPWRKR